MKGGLSWLLVILLFCGVCHAQTEKVTYYYTDPQGTPLAEADASGNIQSTLDYHPYGSVATGSAPNGPGYTGHVNDPESGLVYMQARFYDPSSGRFLSRDPDEPSAGNPLNFNRYDYAGNNPIKNIDPTGKIIEVVGDAAFKTRMNGDLAQIKQGKGGAALISKLEHTRNIVYIMQQDPSKGNQTQADSSGISANGKGTGSDILINTSQTTGGMDANGNKTRPEYVGLGHELGHARAIDQGEQSYDKGDGKPGTTPPSETHALPNENMIRREHNLPERPSYYDPVPKANTNGQ
jgi:RHS repeat-associated protein